MVTVNKLMILSTQKLVFRHQFPVKRFIYHKVSKQNTLMK